MKRRKKLKMKNVDFTSLYPAVHTQKRLSIWSPTDHLQRFWQHREPFQFCQVLRATTQRSLPSCPASQKPQWAHVPAVPALFRRAESERWLYAQWQWWRAVRYVGVLWASESGYQIVCINEVWHLPKKTDAMFKEEVKTFLKYKQEASSYWLVMWKCQWWKVVGGPLKKMYQGL